MFLLEAFHDAHNANCETACPWERGWCERAPGIAFISPCRQCLENEIESFQRTILNAAVLIGFWCLASGLAHRQQSSCQTASPHGNQDSVNRPWVLPSNSLADSLLETDGINFLLLKRDCTSSNLYATGRKSAGNKTWDHGFRGRSPVRGNGSM